MHCRAPEVREMGFSQGGGWMNQVFAVEQVCEKYLANGKYVFLALIYLKKTHDSVIEFSNYIL